jgi:hypothetical protein
MTLLFLIFIGSLCIIGIMVGWKLATVSPHALQQGAHAHARPLLNRHHVPTLDLILLQKYLWHTLLYYLREILVMIVVYPLLGIESLTRFLSRRIHHFIEKTLHYHHEHTRHH